MSSFPRKLDNGKWEHSFRVAGRGSTRYRKIFDTKTDALQFEREKKGKYDTGLTSVNGKYDNYKLSQLCQAWYELDGASLKDGLRRLTKIKSTSERLGDPKGKELSALAYTEYRAARLVENDSKKTLNNELGYMKRVFNCLKEIKAISYDNPLSVISELRTDETELAYLDGNEIKELFRAFDNGTQNVHVALIAEICLATGARWGEAEGLTRQMVRNNRVFLGNDKSRKSGRNRAVQISEQLFKKIHVHFKQHGPFTSSLGAFRRALEKTSIELPKGQASHVLRHTFASHFMMGKGNILVLKDILGHSEIKMTMRYAHFSPSHLQEAVELNPTHFIYKDKN